jgi:hypothetical protein
MEEEFLPEPLCDALSPAIANRTPTAPPANTNNTDSVNICPTSRIRLAPCFLGELLQQGLAGSPV